METRRGLRTVGGNGSGWTTPGESLADLAPARPPARTARQWDPALTALLSFAALILVACSPAIVIGVWRWALG